tara:strand:+ start:256 stop:441 length:186 start_codon:yes stop_codon:yes gene_type:complete
MARQQLEEMSKEDLKALLANYKMRLADSGHVLTPATRQQLSRKIDEISYHLGRKMGLPFNP